MFSILKDKKIKLMLSLSSESRDGISKTNFQDVDIKELYELCLEHELHGVVASHVLEDKLFDLPDYWMDAYMREKEKLEFLKSKASEICSLMRENGIPMIILKNGGIMADIEPHAVACPMEDIDTLVKKSDFLRAHEILVNSGFEFRFRSEFEKEELNEAFADGSTEYFITMPNGEKMWLELSWRPIAGRWIRPDMEPDTDRLFERAYIAENTDVGILSPEDNLLQVCIHTAKHSYVRAPGLRLHLDVERIVKHKEINWNLFLERVCETHVKTSTYYSLMIPKKLFGTDVPDWVLEELKPRKSKARRIENLLCSAGLIHLKGSKFSKLEFLRFQTSLYDSKKDMFRVLYPSFEWYKERFGIKHRISVPYYIIVRCLDLVGIRKKK